MADDDARPTPPHDTAPPVPRLELKAALLLGLFALLLAGSVLYLMYARGAFEPVQRAVLIADDAEGVMVGMDITFAGFPIGRVRRIELGADGTARIVVDVPRRDAHWLRTSSVFTLVRSVVGGTAIKAYSGVLSDPPLPDGAERRVLAGDATAEIPRLLSDARVLIGNLTALTASDSALGGTLGNMHSVTERLKGKQGALGVLLGNEEDARKVITTLERTNTLLARLDGVARKVDGLAARVDGTVARADQQLLGQGGLLPETRAAIVQLNGLLAEARGTLKKADAVMADAQVIAANTRTATTDLGALRAEVEASLRKVELLVDEINRKWPFARDSELKLK
jgi:phospholipid/cholesterol/gamma-HCH transport system substrate-binding protein